MARPPPRIIAAFAATGLAAWALAFAVDMGIARLLAMPDGSSLAQPGDPGPAPDAATGDDADAPVVSRVRRPSSSSRSDYVKAIVERSIFDSAAVGASSSGTVAEGPESKSDLDARLLATVVAEPLEYSSALIARSGGAEARGYGVGDSLFDEGTVVGIEPRRVVIERNDGSREYISMDLDAKAEKLPTGRSLAGDADKDEGVEKVSDTKFVVDAKLVEEAMKDPEKLASQIRVTPHKGADGSVEGYRLSGVRRNSLFSKLGIKNGDVVHAVNGKPLNSVSSAMNAYETLQKDKNFSFEITRRNQKQTFEYEVR